MLSVRRYGTGNETRLASELKRLRISFKMHVQVLAGRRIQPDFVFPRKKVAVFLDGCFWHGCPNHGTLPKANRTWWTNKLSENRRRDVRCLRVLRAHGWIARRFWAHEPPQTIVPIIMDMLKQRKNKE